MSAGTRAMTIVMPARLPGWFVRMEVRAWMKDSVRRCPMAACSVVIVVCFFCQAQGAWELSSPLVGDFSSVERAGTSSSTCT